MNTLLIMHIAVAMLTGATLIYSWLGLATKRPLNYNTIIKTLGVFTGAEFATGLLLIQNTSQVAGFCQNIAIYLSLIVATGVMLVKAKGSKNPGILLKLLGQPALASLLILLASGIIF
jgi:hypothetical protein